MRVRKQPWARAVDSRKLACASNCLLRGDADANTTRFFRNSFSAGRLSGGGGPGGGRLVPLLSGAGDFRASSYDGGGSTGINCSGIVTAQGSVWCIQMAYVLNQERG